MVAYSFVAALSLQLATKENLPFGINKSSAQLMLLGSTTSMATAGAYFLYILTTSFSGSSCSYCLLSVLLSFSLFFITLKDIGLQEKFKQLGLQLFIASLVILTLNTSYSSAKSDASRKLPSLKIGSRKFAHLLRTQLMFKINPLQAERK
ncbi:unnamed protein product [Lathyrus sativus]|nr:unnamed protein product [Lathyrus sativus]